MFKNKLDTNDKLEVSTDYYKPTNWNEFVIGNDTNDRKYRIVSPVLLDSNLKE